jgi:long-subunit fatty acid transport protein
MLLAAAGALSTPAGLAHGAALEQVVPSTVRILYQQGMYAEFGVAYTDPDQEGEGGEIPAGVGGSPIPIQITGNTGDLFEDRWNISAAWKNDINERLSYAVIFDQPFSADTRYGAGTIATVPPIGFTYDGSLADLDTYQVSVVGAYDLDGGFKLYGGLRAQRIDAKAAIPFLLGYEIDADHDWGWGYLLGAAYERPDIALRVALTYFSEVKHDLDTRESSTVFGTLDDTTSVDTPQSVQLDFQTGVAPGTLLFGFVRWVDWSEFAIAPELYGDITAAFLGTERALVDYGDDWWTYNLGVGRQLTDALAGSISITYEPDVGGELTTLGPYDGRTTATAALSYDWGQVNLTGGLTYGKLGDATNFLQTDFDDGSVWGAGLRVGYTF